MRFMLSARSPNNPVYFGYKVNINGIPYGILNGGTGYVMSNKALRLFATEVLAKRKKCAVNLMEDWNMSTCMYTIGVVNCDSRDRNSERFIVAHFFPNPKAWYQGGMYYESDEGLNYISNYSIAFHPITPQHLNTMYFLVYRLSVYGIRHRYPSLPRNWELIFPPVERALLQEQLKVNFTE